MSVLGARFGDGRAAFLVRDAVVQNLPHEATEPMRDGSDRLSMAETDDEATVQQLKILPLLFAARARLD